MRRGRWYHLMLSIVLLLGTTHCAPKGEATGPAFTFETIPPDKALVYIYRQPSFSTSGAVYRVRSDTDTVALVSNGGYYPYLATPGPLTLYASARLFVLENDQRLIHLPVEAGKAYYLRFEFDHPDTRVLDPSMIKPVPRLVYVASAIGAWEIQGLPRFQKR